MEEVRGILYYKAEWGDKVPIDYNLSGEILNEKYRNTLREVYAPSGSGIKLTGEKRKLLDKYEQKTLYLWVEGTEFLVKDD